MSLLLRLVAMANVPRDDGAAEVLNAKHCQGIFSNSAERITEGSSPQVPSAKFYDLF